MGESQGVPGESGALPDTPESWESWGHAGDMVGTLLSPPAAGVHRQVLLASLGCFVGYQLVKRAEYMYAKVDRELLEYIRHHPDDFEKPTGTLRWGLKIDLSPCGKALLG